MHPVRNVLLITATIFGMSSVAHANSLTNGSFEIPAVPAGSFISFNPGSALITGWTVVGAGNVAVVSGGFAQFGVSFPAQDLAQWLDLTGLNGNSIEGVSQTVATVAGDQYQLSYYIGNTSGGGIFGSASTVNVLVNGVLTFSDTNSTPSPTTLNWQQFTHTFTASGASTALRFNNGDSPSDNSNGLDNVVLLDLGPAVTPPSGVPEPASLAILGAGLAGLGWARRRRG